jgi:hypothetical protein
LPSVPAVLTAASRPEAGDDDARALLGEGDGGGSTDAGQAPSNQDNRRVHGSLLVLLSVRHAGHGWRNGKSQPDATDFSAGQRPLSSKTAPTSRAVIEDYLKRSGLDIIPVHEVDNITHAVSMIASTGAVALLPLYPNNLLPCP